MLKVLDALQYVDKSSGEANRNFIPSGEEGTVRRLVEIRICRTWIVGHIHTDIVEEIESFPNMGNNGK